MWWSRLKNTKLGSESDPRGVMQEIEIQPNWGMCTNQNSSCRMRSVKFTGILEIKKDNLIPARQPDGVMVKETDRQK